MENVVGRSSEDSAQQPPQEAGDDLTRDSEFMMMSMKVVPCAKRFVHDWTECPYAHPQEKARRRDPKVHTYTGIACPSMKKEGSCAFGDHCPYAHNVFEYWLHPTRYRTQLCNDGSNCRRKICFFAHSLDELRVPACKPFVSPEGLAAAAAAAAADNELKRKAAAAGLVGSPVASLNLVPQRASMDAPRQSSEWGPAAMPAPIAPSGSSDALLSSSVDEGASESPHEDRSPASPASGSPAGPAVAGSSSTFSPHEQQIIEAVTNMLASDKLSASQAATILQQMLPATSLALLQSSLGLGPPAAAAGVEDAAAAMGRRTMSDPVPGAGLLRSDHVGPSPFGHGGFPATAPGVTTSPRVSMDMASRQSMESARSSFDTARYSFDGRRMSSDSAFPTPRASVDYPPQPQPYAPPAPAYPQDGVPRPSMDQGVRPPLPPRPVAPPAAAAGAGPTAPRYWTGQQLTTVPEGLPMINTPHGAGGPWASAGRYSTGSVGVVGMDAAASAAQRLSSDLSRMSFEENAAAAHAAGGEAGKVNPFASSFFAGGAPVPQVAGGPPAAAAASEFFRPGAW